LKALLTGSGIGLLPLSQEPELYYFGSCPSWSEKDQIFLWKISLQYDFVSRFFAPKLGIDEDPVTGSAHTQLVPYWSRKLDKTKMKAKQVSNRGGELVCELQGNRVLISGKAVKFLEGKIELKVI